MFVFEHLYIWIVSQAIFAYAGEVCCLPSYSRRVSIQILYNGEERSLPERFRSCFICGGMPSQNYLTQNGENKMYRIDCEKETPVVTKCSSLLINRELERLKYDIEKRTILSEVEPPALSLPAPEAIIQIRYGRIFFYISSLALKGLFPLRCFS